MSKIKIKNFGPIKDGYLENDGWLDIKKVTVFIGNQGSGKSTVAKTIASMMWLEKALNRGDVALEEANTKEYFHKLFGYLRLGQEYFRDETEISYLGELYEIKYNSKEHYPNIRHIKNRKYIVPKIMYVPSERNFLSAVREAYDVRGLPPALFEFAEEFRRSQKELKGQQLQLPIIGYNYFYDEKEDKSFIIGIDHKIDLLEASSGFQSLIPLYVVTGNLAKMIMSQSTKKEIVLSVDQSLRMSRELTVVLTDDSLDANDKIKSIELIQKKYKNEVFINVVEEPEQNLFPSSQHKILNSLIEFNNLKEGNKLVITTHSPYLINYLTLAVKAEMVKTNLKSETYRNKLAKFIPLESTVKKEDLVIYEFDEKKGVIKMLLQYKGLPSDENELNKELEDANEIFAQLQELEKGWQ